MCSHPKSADFSHNPMRWVHLATITFLCQRKQGFTAAPSFPMFAHHLSTHPDLTSHYRVQVEYRNACYHHIISSIHISIFSFDHFICFITLMLNALPDITLYIDLARDSHKVCALLRLYLCIYSFFVCLAAHSYVFSSFTCLFFPICVFLLLKFLLI